MESNAKVGKWRDEDVTVGYRLGEKNERGNKLVEQARIHNAIENVSSIDKQWQTIKQSTQKNLKINNTRGTEDNEEEMDDTGNIVIDGQQNQTNS